MELIEFLRARLDDHERAARDAGGETWQHNAYTGHVDSDVKTYNPIASVGSDYDGEHIARHLRWT